jgi:hypothetical protein
MPTMPKVADFIAALRLLDRALRLDPDTSSRLAVTSADGQVRHLSVSGASPPTVQSESADPALIPVGDGCLPPHSMSRCPYLNGNGEHCRFLDMPRPDIEWRDCRRNAAP